MNQNEPQQNQNPTPPQQNPAQTESTSPSPQPKESFWKSKDPAIVIVRIVIFIFIGLPILGIIGAMVLVFLSSSRNANRSTITTPTPVSSVTHSSSTDILNLPGDDQKIAVNVAWLSSQPLTYYSINKTFVGWVPDTKAIDAQIKSLNSEIKVQGIGVNTYVIYAFLPSSKKYYCIDNNKFSGLVDSILPTQTFCR